MTRRISVIFISDDAWRVGIADGDEVSLHELANPKLNSTEEWANLLHDFIAAQNLEMGEVILGIPSSWCLGASVDMAPAEHGKHSAALFALEEKLPIAAEDVAADFQWFRDAAFGVCVDRSRLAGIIELLENQGWSIIAVSPISLLALPGISRSKDDNTGRSLLLGEEHGKTVALYICDGNLAGWYSTSLEPTDIKSLVELVSIQHDRTPLCVLDASLPQASLDAIRSVDQSHVVMPKASERGFAENAIIAANRIISRRQLAPFDLHPAGNKRTLPRKFRRAITAAVASLTFMLVALNLMFWIAQWRMGGQIRQMQDEQVTLFRRVVPDPGQRVPGQIARYLISEHQRMFGARIGADPGMGQAAVLPAMADIFERIPKDLKLQIDRLRMNGGNSEMSGKVATHEDAGRLVNALSGDGRLKVGPVQSAAAPDSAVTFTIQIEHSNEGALGGHGNE